MTSVALKSQDLSIFFEIVYTYKPKQQHASFLLYFQFVSGKESKSTGSEFRLIHMHPFMRYRICIVRLTSFIYFADKNFVSCPWTQLAPCGSTEEVITVTLNFPTKYLLVDLREYTWPMLYLHSTLVPLS